MNIGLVMPLAEQRGGAELMFEHLLAAHVSSGGTPFPVAFLEEGPMVERARAWGYRPHVIPSGRLREPAAYLRTVGRLRSWMRSERPAAVLSWMAKGHLYAGPAAASVGVPAVWFQHGISDGHWMDRASSALPARGVLCCSRAAETAQQGVRRALPTAVTYPSVDLDRFAAEVLPSPACAREQLGLAPEGPVVMLVARLQPGKGVPVFIEAAAAVERLVPKAQFVVVGGADPRDLDYPGRLSEQAHVLGLGDRIRFAGHQSNVATWMQAADCVVSASVAAEGFGMVLVEALALGKAVVATDLGGPREILHSGAGWLVPPGDPAALAQAMVQSVAEPPTAHAVRARRERARAFDATRLPLRVHAAVQRLIAT